MNDFREAALDSLYHQAITDKVQAEASLHILLDHPAGIGDHSTNDLHSNLQEALSNLADAEDRIQALKRFRTKYNQNERS